MIGGEAEGLEEQFGGGFLHREFNSGIVAAVVVIVPDGNDGDLFREGGVVGLLVELAVFLLHDLGVGSVGVDVVAHEKECLGLFLGDCFPNAVITLGFVAGSACDAGDGFLGEGREDEEKGEERLHNF